MASSQDIRQWAADNGYSLKPYGPPTKVVREAFEQAQGQVAVAGDVVDALDPDQTVWPADVEDQAPADAPVPTGTPSTAGEKAPTTRKQRWRDKWRSRGKGGVRGRASSEKMIDLAWSQLARMFDSPAHWPTANVLRMQAPVAGAILDKELRGTPVDGMLQPLARLVNRGSSVGALVALPIMVHLVTVRPELQERLHPLMVDAVYSYLEIAGPEVERKRKQMARRAEQFGIDAEQFLQQVFTPPASMTDPGVADAAQAA